jgi:hypothetical protein
MDLSITKTKEMKITEHKKQAAMPLQQHNPLGDLLPEPVRIQNRTVARLPLKHT